MVGASLRVGLLESVLACLADLVALSRVFVVGGDVTDVFVEPHRVVVVAGAFELLGEQTPSAVATERSVDVLCCFRVVEFAGHLVEGILDERDVCGVYVEVGTFG